MRILPIRLLGFAIAALLVTSCSNDSGGEWGAAAEAFFGDWNEAWSSSDSYDIVRFYDADVAVDLAEDYRSLSLNAGYLGTSVGGDGRAWMVDWIDAQFEARERDLDAVYLGLDRAAAVITIDEINAVSGVSVSVGETLINGYTDLRWRNAHLDGGAPDDRLEWLDDLVSSHLAAWVSGDDEKRDAIYSSGVSIESFPVASVTAMAAAVADEFRFRDGRIAGISSGDRTGAAVFVGPGVAAYVLEATTLDGCRADYMVVWTLDDQIIAHEERLPTRDTVRRCYSVEAPRNGWWNEIAIPLPVGEQVTGVIAERDGTEITVFNGSVELERLLAWGLDRFESAGLVRPELVSATLPRSPSVRVCPGW